MTSVGGYITHRLGRGVAMHAGGFFPHMHHRWEASVDMRAEENVNGVRVIRFYARRIRSMLKVLKAGAPVREKGRRRQTRPGTTQRS